MTRRRLSRRSVLAGGLVTSLGGLAGCVDGLNPEDITDQGDATPEGTQTPDGTPEATGISGDDPPALSGWPNTQYDPMNRGHKPNTTGPTGELTVQWSQQLATRAEGESGAGAPGGGDGVAIQNGVVFATNGGRTVHALRADDGTELWRRQLSPKDQGAEKLSLETPAAWHGLVYLSTGDNGRMVALDGETGETVWQQDSPEPEGRYRDEPPEIFVNSVPTVAEGSVYFGDDWNNVYAVDAETGEREWLNREMDKEEQPIRNQLAYRDGVVYYPNRAFDASTGEIIWQTDQARNMSFEGSPTVYGGSLWIPQSLSMRQVDIESGEARTNYGFETDLRYTGSACAGNGHVYVTQRNNGGVTGIPVDTGAISEWIERPGGRTWQEALPTWNRDLRGSLGRTRPVLVDGVLYVTTLDRGTSYLYGLDGKTGETVCSIEVDGALSGYPAVVDNTVYLNNYRGTFYAITEA